MPAAMLIAARPPGLRDATAAEFDAVASAFPGRVRAMQEENAAADGLRARSWSHPAAMGRGPVADPATGSLLVVLGNPTRPDLLRRAVDAVPGVLLEECLVSFRSTVDSLSPPFALAFWDGRTRALHVAADRCGLQHVYVRVGVEGTVWLSSGLLPLVEILGGTVDPDAVAEWLAAGHFVGERTMFREVRKLGGDEDLRVDEQGVSVERRKPVAPLGSATDEDYRAAFLEALSASHRADGTISELTGGLDSRLVLAGHLAGGLRASTWTLGLPASAEQRTVRRLRRRVDFEHIVVAPEPGAAQRLPDLVAEMHELADGEVNALEYAPLLLAFEQLAERRNVSVSGAGGEIGRGYYYKAIDGSSGNGGVIDVEVLAGKLAGATRPVLAALPTGSNGVTALGPLRATIERQLAYTAGRPPDQQLDDFYIRGRMQRFGGRNVTTTGLFARQALPFFDNRLVQASLALAHDRKVDGRVVRAALEAWSPELSRVSLDSGVSVGPRSVRHPGRHVRWAAAMGRKVAVRYGGAAGQRLVAAPRQTLPWIEWAASPTLRSFIGDVLPPQRRIDALLDPDVTGAIVGRALTGGSLYPVGLLLTLELTLARVPSGASVR